MRQQLIAFTLTASLATAGAAFAAPSGNDAEEAEAVANCATGEVWDAEKSECVPSDQQSFTDDALFENGRALAYLGRFDEAVTVLSMIGDRDRPDVLNYLGYATRNAGDLRAGLAFYRRAITLDPNYTLARAYMGQALLLDGDKSGALAQLDEIERRCGRDCRGYAELAEAIVAVTEDQSWRY